MQDDHRGIDAIRARLTYANVTASIALFVALGTGGAYAAGQLIGTDDIRNRAVTAPKIADDTMKQRMVQDDAIRARHVRDGAVGQAELSDDIGTFLQKRVTGSCSTNNAVQSVAEDGTVGCESFVTGVTAGSGLSGGTITDSGALSVDPTQTQSRVNGSCGGSQAIQSVAQNGGVTCQSFAPASGVLNSGVVVAANTETTDMVQANGFAVVLDCSNSTDSKVLIRALTGNAGNVLADSNSLGFTVAGGLDGNAAPPANSQTIGSTTGNDRGDYDIGNSTGPNQGETLSGSFSSFKFAGGCVGTASALAS